MAEFETQEVDTDEVDTQDTDTDNTDTDTEDTEDADITYEQAMAWKKQAQRTAKAEAKLVWLKKELKKDKKVNPTNLTPKAEVKKILAEEKFYTNTPDAEAYREKIEGYQEKGLSIEDWYLLASKNDKEIDSTREVYWKSIVKWTTNTEWISLVSMDSFDRMTPEMQSDYTDKMNSKYWAIKFK